MRQATRFHPSVPTLEERLLPTTAVAYPDVVRTALHESYVAEADQRTSDVVFLGDSITYLWGTTSRAAPGSSSWDADFAGLKSSNFGISGDQTQNLLYRVENGELNGAPKVAVVMIGINDLFGGRTADQAASGVASVVRAVEAESPDTKILLLGVLPTASVGLNNEVFALDVDLSSLASSTVTYLDVDSRLETSNGTLPTVDTIDGVHPSATGYAVIASAIDGTIDKLLHPVVPSTTTTSTTATTRKVDLTTPTQASLTESIPIVIDPSTINPPSTQVVFGSTTAPKPTAIASSPSSIADQIP